MGDLAGKAMNAAKAAPKPKFTFDNLKKGYEAMGKVAPRIRY
jgi:hypothetical protein